MSLYRQYRPKSFSDVVGQDHIVSTLENAVLKDKIAQAYLLAGSRGTGKTSVARILAKILLTRGAKDEVLQRHIIAGVDDGSIVDLMEIDGASNRGIDDIRTLIEKIQFSPVVASAKVYIIDEVHMLTKEAFNALLKTLEEPPPYAYFILATTELQKIPATIQSRCQRFAFRQIPEEEIVRRLQYIADQEHIDIDRAAVRAIAHHAQGGLRDAISVLDQLRSLPKITIADVKQRIGESGMEHVETLFEALNQGNVQAMLQLVATIEEAGVSLEHFTRELLGETRLRLHRAIKEDQPIDTIAHMIDILLAAIRDMRIAPVPGLVLESALISLCRPANQTVIAKAPLLSRESPPKEEKKAAVTPTPAPAMAEVVKNDDAIVEAPEFSQESVLALWPKFLSELQPAAVKISLKNGRITEVQNGKIVVTFASKFHRDRVAQKDALFVIEQSLHDIFKRTVRLDCIVTEERASPPTPDAALVDLASAASEVF